MATTEGGSPGKTVTKIPGGVPVSSDAPPDSAGTRSSQPIPPMTATHDPLTRLAPYLDPTLRSPLHVALIGIASGLQETELEHLPGLANCSRRTKALDELRALGRVDASGRAVPGASPAPAELQRMLRGKKLRDALEQLSAVAPGLRARGLEELADSLPAAEATGLEALLRARDRFRSADVEFRRLRKQSRLAFVERRIPERGAHMDADVPADLVAQTLALVAVDQDMVGSARMANRIQRLHDALDGDDRAHLQRWWEILLHFSHRGRSGEALYIEWIHRMQSYVLRRQLRVPRGLWLASESTPQEIKGRFPVPNCAYGPWVDDELKLYGAVISPLRRRVGYDLARAAWIGAHETLVREGRPASDDEVRRAASRVARELHARVHPSDGPWAHFRDPIQAVEERRAIHRAVAWAKDDRSGLCLDAGVACTDASKREAISRRRVATRFLAALARRAAGDSTEAERIAALTEEILSRRVRPSRPRRVSPDLPAGECRPEGIGQAA